MELSAQQALSEIVVPAIARVLQDGELDSLQLGWGDITVAPADSPIRCLVLRLEVVGEVFNDVIYDIRSADTQTLDGLRERLDSNLVDFVAESSFGWGQNRERR